MEHIQIDASNTCTLKCPYCARQTHKDYGGVLSLGNYFKLLDFYDHLSFSGQISDPIFNPNLITMLNWSQNKSVSVHTAATSPKHKEDWYLRAFKSNPQVTWIFGLDGPVGWSEKHRLGQDSAFLMDIMLMGAGLGIKIIWQCILFKFNEEYIDSCREFADKEGLEFQLNLSTRFSQYDPMQPSRVVETIRGKELNPKCLVDQPHNYSAKGFLTPCCWIDNHWHMDDENVQTLYSEELRLENNTVKDIVDSDAWKQFKVTFSKPCWNYCTMKNPSSRKII